MQGKKKLKKYTRGTQSINADNLRAKQESVDGIVKSATTTAVNAFVPGLGTVLGAADGIADNLSKNSNGLYKSKGAQLANTFLNPIERIQSGAKAWGKVFKGDFKGAGKALIGDQSDLKDAIKKDQQEASMRDYHDQIDGVEETATQMGQAKKGRKYVKNKDILIEGGEPVFSKKDSSGDRDLLYYNPDKSLSHKSGNDIPISAPEGAAIVTNNDSKSDKAVAAYKRGDKKQLNKIINEMPEDNKKAYKKGTKKLKKYSGGVSSLDPTQFIKGFAERFNAAEDSKLLSMNGASQPFMNKVTTALSGIGKDVASKDWKGAATQSGKYAPTIYNIGKGLGSAEKVNRRFYNPTKEKITDMSASAIQGVDEASNLAASNARNAAGGNMGNLRSNRQTTYNNKMKAKSDIYMRENLRQTEAANRNLERNNESKRVNLDLANKYDDMDAMNRGKKSEAMAKGLTGVSDIIQGEELMKNQMAVAKENSKLATIGRNYRADGTYKSRDEYKKGAKSVKVYKRKNTK